MNAARTLLTAAIACVAFPASAGPWGATEDFDVSSNPNAAWSYGYYLLPAAVNLDLSNDFHALQLLTTPSSGTGYKSWGLDTSISSVSTLYVSTPEALLLTAGYSPLLAFYAPVVRWTAPSDGTYKISGSMTYSGVGGGVTAYSQGGVRTEGGIAAYQYFGGSADKLEVDLSLLLQAGQFVDFFTARGLQSIALDAHIRSVQEPSPLLLFLIAIPISYGRLLCHRSRRTATA